MTEGINGNSGSLPPGAGHTTPDSAHFRSIDEIQSACEADGWSIEIRQLQAGEMTADTISRECADISLLDQTVSRRVEFVGQAPEGYITALAPVGRGEFSINGHLFDGQGLFLLQSSAELHSINNDILRVMSMLVPTSLLQETGRGILDAWNGQLPVTGMVIEPGAAGVSRLRSMIHATIEQPATGRWQVEQGHCLATGLAAIIDQHAGTAKTNGRTSPAESWRAVSRARAFIETHLTEPITISKVCAHSAMSLSKLERSFRRELQMSPSQYILARRLAAVNRELKGTSSSGKKIVHIAMNFGFTHLGRFAGIYRKQFGELPSETLLTN